ncbi:Eukaryotic translation initiation factor 1, partial [Lemmus lemmus]
RIQQSNSGKNRTIFQGIADEYDKFSVIEHPEYGEVIQLQVDQCKNICQFLIEIGLAEDDQLKGHGF